MSQNQNPFYQKETIGNISRQQNNYSPSRYDVGSRSSKVRINSNLVKSRLNTNFVTYKRRQTKNQKDLIMNDLVKANRTSLSVATYMQKIQDNMSQIKHNDGKKNNKKAYISVACTFMSGSDS